MDAMNILVSCNDNYAMPQTVLLESLFENNPGPVAVWFMWSELSEENRAFFRDYIESHGAELHYVPVGETEFRGLPRKEYISRETYFRLLAAEYLPESVEKILWLDADMIVTGDIREFYDTDISAYAVAACPHGPAMRLPMQKNCLRIGLEHPEQYFNAGVMLCNLKRWREMDVPGRIERILQTPRDMRCPGQDLTNLVFDGEVLTADWERYNLMTHSITPDDVPRLKDEARIVHFPGKAKPWTFNDLPFSAEWMEYYKKSPFGGERLRINSYFRMKDMARKFNDRVSQNYFRFLFSRFKQAGAKEEIVFPVCEYRFKLVFAGFDPGEAMRYNLGCTGESGEELTGEFDETAYIWKDDLAPLLETIMLSPEEKKILYHSNNKSDILLPGDKQRLAVRDKINHVTYIVFSKDCEIPGHYIRKPFINELQWWVSDKYFVLHSALVGTRRKGALILGQSGAGKSTLAMSCLLEGMDYVSEDYTLISREGPIVGRPIYPTGNLSLAMIEGMSAPGRLLYYDKERDKYLLELPKDRFDPKRKLLIEIVVFPILENLEEPVLKRIKTGLPFIDAIATTASQVYSFRNLEESFPLLFDRLKYLPEFQFFLSSDTRKNAEYLKNYVERYHEGDENDG